MTGHHSRFKPYMSVLGNNRYQCQICNRIIYDPNGWPKCDHELRIFVPGRPLPKQSARFGKGRSWQPKAKQQYKKTVELFVREAWLKAGKPKYESPFSVRLDFVFAWPKSTKKALRDTYAWRTSRPDLDNLTKMCLDSLSLLIPEDSTVVELWLTKRNGPADKEGVTITIMNSRPHDTNDDT